MTYVPQENRYDLMKYNRCGKWGLKLPAVSLGLWHNFGGIDTLENGRNMLHRAFDLGITHFDLANNYGPPPGSAEENFGRILRQDFAAYRDELIISSKAGYLMWPGPYGEWGSRKYVLASLDQSLKRMGLEYVDIFYSHRPDPDTPLEETMMALDRAVGSGKALYVGISNYPADMTKEASKILKELGTPCLIHQPRYSMFERWVEAGEENAIRIRVYGDKGGLDWEQMEPNTLTAKWHGQPTQIFRVGTSLDSKIAAHNTRTPGGHPEGYLEAFANIYRNFSLTVRAKMNDEEPTPEMLDFPGVEDGIRGMQFIDAVVKAGYDDNHKMGEIWGMRI